MSMDASDISGALFDCTCANGCPHVCECMPEGGFNPQQLLICMNDLKGRVHGRYPVDYDGEHDDNHGEGDYDIADKLIKLICKDKCPQYEKCQPEDDESNDNQMYECVTRHLSEILDGKYPEKLEYPWDSE